MRRAIWNRARGCVDCLGPTLPKVSLGPKCLSICHPVMRKRDDALSGALCASMERCSGPGRLCTAVRTAFAGRQATTASSGVCFVTVGLASPTVSADQLSRSCLSEIDPRGDAFSRWLTDGLMPQVDKTLRVTASRALLGVDIAGPLVMGLVWKDDKSGFCAREPVGPLRLGRSAACELAVFEADGDGYFGADRRLAI